MNVPTINTTDAKGLRKGFWNLFIFSIKGIVTNPMGTAALEITPSSLFGITLSKLKVEKKTIPIKSLKSKGVGSRIPNPIQQEMVPIIQIGKI